MSRNSLFLAGLLTMPFGATAQRGELGPGGNSHMIMQDKNNLQVADRILTWIGDRVNKPRKKQGGRT
jgi:hypothetical protein